MKFYDQVDIVVQSGRGGDGIASGRREKGEARGGPAGGDGGRGGSVIFVASKDEYTLMKYRYQKTFKAKNGGPGQGDQKYGANAEDIILSVPFGTLIKEKETGILLAHLKDAGEKFCVVAGGRGGIGNMHFTTPSNQYPSMYLLGEPGIKKEISLELQLLGDVALIGTPSVGKSTLINAVSNVKAKTADYEFTTLVPNIGVVDHKGKSFIMVDVPGLIAGASSGKGLGADFLRHILKARIRVIMLDAVKDIPGIDEWSLLVEEIISYCETRFYKSKEFGQEIEKIQHHITRESGLLRYETRGLITGERKTLLKKALMTVVNKYDVLDDELRQEYASLLTTHIQSTLKKKYACEVKQQDIQLSLLNISALTHDRISVFLDMCIHTLSREDFTNFVEIEKLHIPQTSIKYIEDVSAEEKSFLFEEGYLPVEGNEKTKIREIYDEELSYLTFVIPRGNDEAELRYRKTLQEKGYIKRFDSKKVKRGDVLKIISVYDGSEDKYVLYV